MADITDERLREVREGTYCGFDEGVAIAAELISVRAEVERLLGLIREYLQAIDGLAVDDSAEAQNLYERAEDALREARRG